MKLRALFIFAFAAIPISLGFGGCAQPKQSKVDQAKNLQAGSSASQVKPTTPSPTVLEGGWVGPCTVTGTNLSRDIGYVFHGNSYFKQETFYWESDACEQTDESFAAGSASTEVTNNTASGYFTLGAADANGQQSITFNTLVNGPSNVATYGVEYNLIRKDGNGSIIWMSNLGSKALSASAKTDQEYDTWQTYLPSAPTN